MIAAAIGGVVGAGVVASVLVAVLGTGSHGKAAPPGPASAGATPSATTSSTPPLTGTAAAMVALLAKGSGLSYHARYAVSSPSVAQQGATVVLELWRRPPQVRQDTTVTAKGKTSETAAFQNASGVTQCTRQGTADFACKLTSSSGLSSPADLAAAAAKELTGADVTQKHDTVAGHAGTCFEIAAAGATTEICVDDEGIPLRISAAGTSMVLQVLDHSFASGVFTPPEAAS